jgi:hypothetical protein
MMFRTALVHLTKNIEQERINVEEESFMIKEQFGDVAKILTVQSFFEPIHLKHFSKTGF